VIFVASRGSHVWVPLTGITVRELSEVELPSAAAIAARGMRDNPLHIAAFGDDPDNRQQRLARMFEIALPLILSKGTILGVFDGGTLAGIAGMIAPGKCQPSFADRLWVMPRLVPALGGGTFARVGRWMGEWARRDPKQPHWHLGPVSVDAHLQGQGFGTLLMTEYCARLDRAKMPGYLETDRQWNVRFYEGFGFETVDSALVLGVPNWFMKRTRP